MNHCREVIGSLYRACQKTTKKHIPTSHLAQASPKTHPPKRPNTQGAFTEEENFQRLHRPAGLPFLSGIFSAHFIAGVAFWQIFWLQRFHQKMSEILVVKLKYIIYLVVEPKYARQIGSK